MPVLHLNCEALVGLAHAFLAVARPGAALVNVASTPAFSPRPGQAVYGATKAFVHAFSQALWFEQRPRGIHVPAVCPGPTATRPDLHADTPAAPVGTRRRWPPPPSGSSTGGAATPWSPAAPTPPRPGPSRRSPARVPRPPRGRVRGARRGRRAVLRCRWCA
ncbi:SDR family NAD(P)-dependent oxidoreductase [Streptomyces sp. NPDC090445]|uniref:SDR family NAD(P)-dependent oxidoreductase n=1 Tax=Streptomyces sp. NPDC090445 TaxID=3365963 RepID=UPI003822B9A9